MQGVIHMKRRSECLALYGSDYKIQQRVKKGELFQIEKGIFSEKPDVPELAILTYKYPNAVVTMRNAFYIYGLTDVIPDKYDLATDRNAAKIPDKRVRQYFYPTDFFRDGTDTINYKGYRIPIYCLERMLIELIRYKKKLPFDYYKEIILNYRKILPRLNIERIQDFELAAPKSNKILETLQMEVL